ncbi:MAG: VOC family protein [Gammaproteobacteria bacterium]
MPASLHLYVADVDATYRAALTAGGESLEQPINRFWGDRTAGIKDPAGNKWWITTQVELAPDERARRTQACQYHEKKRTFGWFDGANRKKKGH